MTHDPVVREARSEDLPAILELVRLCLGEGGSTRKTEAFWRWKHEENPFGRSPALVAEADGALVGLRTFLRWEWWLDGERVPAVRAVDTATHPDYRGRGIFTRLTLELLERMHEEGVAFVFNTPNDRSRPGYLKMGWSDLGRVSLWVRPNRPLRLARGLVRMVRNARPTPGSSAGDDPCAAAEALPSVRTLLESPFPLEDVAESRRHSARLTTAITREYLAWRYANNPEIAYRALWRLEADGGAALIVRLERTQGLLQARICEVLGHGSNAARLARDLLQKLNRGVRPDYAAVMADRRSLARRTARRSVFVPGARMGPSFTVRRLAANGLSRDPLRRRSWQLSIGDLELF